MTTKTTKLPENQWAFRPGDVVRTRKVCHTGVHKACITAVIDRPGEDVRYLVCGSSYLASDLVLIRPALEPRG